MDGLPKASMLRFLPPDVNTTAITQVACRKSPSVENEAVVIILVVLRTITKVPGYRDPSSRPKSSKVLSSKPDFNSTSLPKPINDSTAYLPSSIKLRSYSSWSSLTSSQCYPGGTIRYLSCTDREDLSHTIRFNTFRSLNALPF